MATRIKLKDTNLAERIRDDLFSPEERNAISYLVGSLHVDVKEQILHHYGNHYLLHSEQETFLAFAQLKEEKALPYIEKLKVFYERLPYMMQPSNFYKKDRKEYVRDQTNSHDGSNTTSSISNYNSYSYTSSETEGDNRSANIGKTASALNSQETIGLEKQMYDGLKQGSFGGNRKNKKKVITYNIDNEGKLTNLGIRDEEAAINPIQPFEPTKEPVHLYASQTIATNGSLGDYQNTSSAEGMSVNKGIVEGTYKAEGHAVGHISGGINIQSYVSTEADLKTLKADIPRIRTRLWGVFWPLFTMRKY